MRATRLALVGLLIAPTWAAFAQVPIEPAPAARTPAPAPALPGLAARRAPAAIPGDPNANLSPNAALFDAVNRGDIAAARDAVARGANPEARNSLGLTALDTAVDQGRNDIAFYLLSARDLSRGPPPGAAPAASLGAPPAARPEPRRPAATAAASATPRNARLWANDGGSARPEIGFLGFDAGRPARGRL